MTYECTRNGQGTSFGVGIIGSAARWANVAHAWEVKEGKAPTDFTGWQEHEVIDYIACTWDLVIDVHQEIAEEYPLLTFCYEEASYRVNDMTSLDDETMRERLIREGRNVTEFIEGYARCLFENAERWIDGDAIEQMMNEYKEDTDER